MNGLGEKESIAKTDEKRSRKKQQQQRNEMWTYVDGRAQKVIVYRHRFCVRWPVYVCDERAKNRHARRSDLNANEWQSAWLFFFISSKYTIQPAILSVDLARARSRTYTHAHSDKTNNVNVQLAHIFQYLI